MERKSAQHKGTDLNAQMLNQHSLIITVNVSHKKQHLKSTMMCLSLKGLSKQRELHYCKSSNDTSKVLMDWNTACVRA